MNSAFVKALDFPAKIANTAFIVFIAGKEAVTTLAALTEPVSPVVSYRAALLICSQVAIALRGIGYEGGKHPDRNAELLAIWGTHVERLVRTYSSIRRSVGQRLMAFTTSPKTKVGSASESVLTPRASR